MHDDDFQPEQERSLFHGGYEEYQQFQRDLEIHSLNLKLHLSEEGFWLARGRKLLVGNLVFAFLAVNFTVYQLFFSWGSGPSWAISILCSLISLGFAIRHSRCLKKAKAASEAFRSLEPPASLRPLKAAIDAQIEAEDEAAKSAKNRRGWRKYRR